MSALATPTRATPVTFMMRALRVEAAIEPPPVSTAAVTKQTQIIAIYGKGGIGKSFTLANLSYMLAPQGKKVLLIGCDPKSDTTSLLFGGRACPTIIETSSKKKLAGEAVAIGHVCFKRDGVYAMELGGPEVGRGCGGRGIIHGFELLEKLGFHEWGFDSRGSRWRRCHRRRGPTRLRVAPPPVRRAGAGERPFGPAAPGAAAMSLTFLLSGDHGSRDSRGWRDRPAQTVRARVAQAARCFGLLAHR